MSPREVIARAVICDWQTADEDSRDYGLDLADAILAALDAAGLEVRPKQMDREKTLRRWVQATAREPAP